MHTPQSKFYKFVYGDLSAHDAVEDTILIVIAIAVFATLYFFADGRIY